MYTQGGPAIIQNIKISSKKKQRDNKIRHLFWNVPMQNGNFIGRHEVFSKLNKYFSGVQGGDKTQPVTIISCYGLGGVGKSQIALELCYRDIDYYSNIFWISAEDENNLLNDYVLLAEELSLPTDSNNKKTASEVKKWLEKNKNGLIIYDNAQSYEMIEQYIPRISNHVLITSRHTEWPGCKIEIDTFNSDDAKAYILKVLNNGDDIENIIEYTEKQAITLAKKMGYLPLAIAQACYYIRSIKIGVDDYLILYKKHKTAYLTKKGLPPGDKHIPVAITWDVTIKTINKESDLAGRLLNVCAYLNADNIPHFFLEQFIDSPDKNKLLDALNILSSYSMIKYRNNNIISIHRILQKVIRINIKNKNERINYLSDISKKMNAVFLDRVDAEGLRFNNLIYQIFYKFERRVKNKIHLLPHEDLISLINNYHVAISFKMRISISTHEVKKYVEMSGKIINLLHRNIHSIGEENYDLMLVQNYENQIWGMLVDGEVDDYAEELMEKAYNFRLKMSIKYDDIEKLKLYVTNATDYTFLLTRIGTGKRKDADFVHEKIERAYSIIRYCIDKMEKYEGFKSKYPHNYAQCYSALGSAAFSLNKIDEAIISLEKAFSIFIDRGHFPNLHQNSIYVGNRLAKFYFFNKETNKSIEILEKIIAIAEEVDPMFRNNTTGVEYLKAIFSLKTAHRELGNQPDIKKIELKLTKQINDVNLDPMLVDLIRNTIPTWFTQSKADNNMVINSL